MKTTEAPAESGNREWSEEILLREIRAWRRQGRPLYSHYMRQHYQELLAAGIRYFGSWEKAVETAGISYAEVRRYQRWSKKSIVEKIRALHAQGADLSFRALMLSPYAPMVYAAIRPVYFGSWKDALLAAGLAPADIYRYRSWKDADILREIRRLHAEGADLSSKHMDEQANSLIATARRRFGCWGAAVERAGLDYAKIRKRKRWSEAEIIEQIRALQAQGVPLTSTEVRNREPSLFAAACKRRFFGSWRQAIQSALGKAERASQDCTTAGRGSNR
ncbi:homing endonuclease associated repeat-containing protein [Methylacidimicrobium sp. B4]|uniref:homing endonuclease associated repeat-containing protein n=1 Tax=Methylacidimicrobium sp. B4 TaxID=2796139 RepID=UPI001A8F0128|nr:hypothetical protein [Methylacidimicrobium sp. B4]QSR84146.1 hypothetical protein MacB4_07810 [Methylacidimicrobium sp. B4]